MTGRELDKLVAHEAQDIRCIEADKLVELQLAAMKRLEGAERYARYAVGKAPSIQADASVCLTSAVANAEEFGALEIGRL